MKITTLKVGVMELNFGDAHSGRSDNGRLQTIHLFGNYIMESFHHSTCTGNNGAS